MSRTLCCYLRREVSGSSDIKSVQKMSLQRILADHCTTAAPQCSSWSAQEWSHGNKQSQNTLSHCNEFYFAANPPETIWQITSVGCYFCQIYHLHFTFWEDSHSKSVVLPCNDASQQEKPKTAESCDCRRNAVNQRGWSPHGYHTFRVAQCEMSKIVQSSEWEFPWKQTKSVCNILSNYSK